MDTKLYHIAKDGLIWLVARANGIDHWLYPKGPTGSRIR